MQIDIPKTNLEYSESLLNYLDKDNNWKIINIEINGMNLGKIFRNQFYSLMEKNKGDINLVIEKWVTSV